MKDKRTYLASYYGTVDKRSLEQQICGPMWGLHVQLMLVHQPYRGREVDKIWMDSKILYTSVISYFASFNAGAVL